MAAGSTARWAVAVLTWVCFLLSFDFISCDTRIIYGAMNGTVTLSPSSAGPFKEMLWLKGKDKVADWGETYKIYPPYTDRVHLDTTSGDLTIFNLTSSDEDEYEIESLSLKNKIKFFLKVLEPLPSPVLNCSVTDENITISCKAPANYSSHQDLIRYSWRCHPAQCDSSLQNEAYFKKNDDLSQEVQCIVSNPLFNTTSSMVLTTCMPPDYSRHRYGLIPLPLVALSIFAFVKVFLQYGRDTERRNPS